MLQPDLVVKEMAALQKHFKEKLDYTIERLESMGFIFPVSALFLPYHTYDTPVKRLLKNPWVLQYKPDSTFYVSLITRAYVYTL